MDITLTMIFFYIEGCLVNEREINCIDYCIEKMIENIIEDKHDLIDFNKEYKNILLNRFFKFYPNIIMEMIEN